jgi:hypothetical protein
MKTLPLLLSALLLVGVAESRALDDIKILPTPVKLDSVRETGKGNTNIESKKIAYTVKVTSSSFSEIQNVAVKYNIFYQVSELGQKGDPEVKVSAGSHTFPSLLTNRPQEFETDPIRLDKASLDAGWYFANGASAKSRDKVVGVWFKAFDSTGKKIGEYINPSTLTNKRKWKE